MVISKLNNYQFIRLALLTEEEKQAIRVMKPIPLIRETPKSNTNVLDYNDDQEEEDDEAAFEKARERHLNLIKQDAIAGLDDAIKSGLFNQDTKDSLLNHVIAITKNIMDMDRDEEHRWLTDAEYDNLVRDVVETTYNSLVYKIGHIPDDIMPY